MGNVKRLFKKDFSKKAVYTKDCLCIFFGSIEDFE